MISNKNKKRHYINTCIDIPDKIKVKLIDKHNNNSKTIKKLDIVLYNNNGSKLVNGNNNTYNITNNITQVKLNPVGQEKVDHISFERMVEIIESGNRMIKEYCKEVYRIEENKNAFVDTRRKVIYFINDKNELEIEHMNEMLSKIVDTHIRKINKFFKDNEANFSPRTKVLFQETYSNYFCIINLSNMNDSDYIEKEHRLVSKDFNDDMWLSLYKIKDNAKDYLELDN
jgi:hypothetical protein